MKHSVFLATCAFACGAALAQAPAGVVQRPSAESNPIAAGGAPAEKAQMKTDMKKDGAMPMAGVGMSGGSMAKGGMAMGGMGMGMGMSMDMKMMDTNRDGMISRKEWMDYHAKMWGRMKSKRGMVSTADMEAMMKGGPN
jgi:hypothetical protein